MKKAKVCKVCGSEEIHSTNINQPTMKCIEFLRSIIISLCKSAENLADVGLHLIKEK